MDQPDLSCDSLVLAILDKVCSSAAMGGVLDRVRGVPFSGFCLGLLMYGFLSNADVLGVRV